MSDEIYKVFCIVERDASPLSVKLSKGDTIDELKKAIKKEKSPDFDQISAEKLVLFQVDISALDMTKALGEITALELSFDKAMNPAYDLSDYYSAAPPKKTIHIFVQLPHSAKRRRSPSDTGDYDAKRVKNMQDIPLGQKRPASSELERPERIRDLPSISPSSSTGRVSSDASDGLYPRSETVRDLYKMLEAHRFIFVRGTPASGKSSLAYLLRAHVTSIHPARHVCLVSRYRYKPKEQPVLYYRKWLEEKGWKFQQDGVLIIDEAQLSYWDEELWTEGLKSINTSTPYMIILFASYGSTGRNLLDKTTFRVQDEQLIGLARSPNSSVGLLLTREETKGFVRKKFPDHHFDESLLKYVYDLTYGHVGAYFEVLNVVIKDNSYRHRREGSKYTYQDFILSFETADILQQLYDCGIFSRGLPSRGDLRNYKYTESLLQVLNKPERFVIVTEEEDHDPNNPLRQCLVRGWLFSEHDVEERIKYRFASPLHELYTAWLLLGGEASLQNSDLSTFVVKVIEHFSP